jgi:hypothetical protein
MPTSPRKRGAQPSNTNALKHGFYSREFRQAEINDLPALQLRLEDEIAAARVAGRRILELSRQMTDPMDGVRALTAFSNHLARIARLMRTHHILTGGGDDASQAISQAILDIAKEFNIL